MNLNTPNLDELKNQGDGFRRADADFFRQLAKDVEAKAKPQAKTRTLWPYLISAAAAVLLLIYVRSGSNGLKPDANTNANAEDLIEELTDEEIFAYIEDNVHEFELELLSEELEIDDFIE
ncbi:MAG: hypothetical protein AAF741_03945 [Bacteroidota bacterium]